ncbi:MAG: hypothetical protein HOC91_03520 [Nitrospinaceae bacterium]|nr:hypothetical protein [Nitrospinaceae bacterium]MBT3433323.1 hypothetical protein [Nitrospinaceae bacterium]MBT3820439.1 hypothetical protein [Nitrospinaceae bacterium]MBT4093779.1 hypothetical protein [Nitrospinaceae bacterium]MBT4429564.1 hypothetical protein [Nitrospinaceae bacterium]
MESPIEGRSTSHVPGERIIDKPELPAQGVATDSEVFTEVVLGSTQLKRGTVEDYEVFCDESPRIGGEGKYPSPMSYMAMGTGF